MKPIIIITIFFMISTYMFAYTGEVVESYSTPGDYPTGLTFDGENLWLADRETNKIYMISSKNGRRVRRIETPGFWPAGLTWDGEALWCSDVKGGLPLSENYEGKIYRIDLKTSTVLKTLQAPCKSPRGLAWDGKYLWCSDNTSDELICFSPDDGTTIKSFKSPAGNPQGLSYDGKYIWISDSGTDEIYMVDPETGCVIIIADASGPYIRDIAFDGEFLWSVDSQIKKIFKHKIRDGQKLMRYKPRESVVTYRHKTRNYGPGIVKTLDIHLAVPVNRNNQEIRSKIKFNPVNYDSVSDKWGQKTARYNYRNIKPGETVNCEMTVDVTTYDVRYFIYPEEVGSLEEIPKEIKNIYLEDNEKYQMTHPVIKNAVKKAVGNERNPYWICRRIFDYIISNMYYEMTGGWNTAPTVLERGNGSCSEYTFVFISMCRSAGIPARYVGSVVMRGESSSMDDVFHRWVEVFLPNYGWIPIDPSGGDSEIPRNQTNFIGHIANRYLITTQSGGDSETMEWTYNSNEFYTTEAKTFIVFDNYADWQPRIVKE
jgi:transglutaminase-like putative cysteine protease/sugar lactone lactonase YvrE